MIRPKAWEKSLLTGRGSGREDHDHDCVGACGCPHPDVHDDPQSGTGARAGQAASAEVMQKAVGMVGTIQGVSQGKIARLQHPEDQEQVKYYLIQQGETLSKIAQHFSGHANPYPRIFDAHREGMRDANLRFPGQTIRMPAASDITAWLRAGSMNIGGGDTPPVA